MGGARASADDTRVRARPLLAALVGTFTVAAFVGASTNATAGRACLSGTRDGGYAYAGNQAAQHGHGVRATITMTRRPNVEAGHVAGWVGVGGPGQGANGEDAWIQAGIASLPGMDPMIYAEITRAGRAPQFVPIEEGVAAGRSHNLAVLEMADRPGWWRVWVDGRAVTDPSACAAPRGAGHRSRPPRAGTPERRPATRSRSGSSASRSRTEAAARGVRSCPAHRFLDGDQCRARSGVRACAVRRVRARVGRRDRRAVRVRRDVRLGVSDADCRKLVSGPAEAPSPSATRPRGGVGRRCGRCARRLSANPRTG